MQLLLFCHCDKCLTEPVKCEALVRFTVSEGFSHHVLEDRYCSWRQELINLAGLIGQFDQGISFQHLCKSHVSSLCSVHYQLRHAISPPHSDKFFFFDQMGFYETHAGLERIMYLVMALNS